ncbi:MAG: hypothetical protein ACE5FG_09740 [Myxococcota bacterium]
MGDRRRVTGLLGLALSGPLLAAPSASATTQIPTTSEDFRLPGTQPLSVSDLFATPDACTPCHSGYGQPEVEPYRNWQSGMMAQAGRDPLMWAALAVANQDVAHVGETCLRCHLPKGWLEGRSAASDGTLMTAADRHGVQCSVCHRLVNPFPDPNGAAEDAGIRAALAAPVPILGNAMMVVDPLARLRGPFDIVADLGSDPHIPDATTFVSEFHESSELCGMCHNLRNPAFTHDPNTGEYVLNALDTPGEPALGFPEQSTYDEWAASAYAAGGVAAPRFSAHGGLVSSCQDCHMPHVSGRDAELGLDRDDIPVHELVGANTFIPAVLPHHPSFGAEVDPEILSEGITKATTMLRRAATLSLDLSGDHLTVRVTNETGHKLPTGYPEGRRMWLHVRAFDADRNVVFESGRYTFATATLQGYGADPNDPAHDPSLHVWEAHQGLTPAVAAAAGLPVDARFHLALNNVRLFDNRIPPRGFTQAAFAAFDGAPVGASFADGQYWDEVVYPVGSAAAQAEVTLYYQTASREYVEFLRDENTTNAAGFVLFDLWDQHGRSEPVAMAHAFLETNAQTLGRCRDRVARGTRRYLKQYLKAWGRCYRDRARGRLCDTTKRDQRLARAEGRLRAKLGGPQDSLCLGRSLTPITLGHGSVCPVPCATTVLFDLGDLASCAICVGRALGKETLEAAYGTRPPALPPALASPIVACQKAVARGATKLALGWSDALLECESANAEEGAALDCASDPGGEMAAARSRAARLLGRCDDFAGLSGCGATGSVAATETCLETAIGPAAASVAEVPFP